MARWSALLRRGPAAVAWICVCLLVGSRLEAASVTKTVRAGKALGWGVLAENLHAVVTELGARLRVSVAPADRPLPGADILVRGRAEVTDTQPNVPFSGRSVAQVGLATAAAAVHVEARWLDEDQPVAVLEAQGRGAGTSAREAGERALQHGISQLSEDLRRALSEDLRRRSYGGRTVQVVVESPRVGSGLDELARDLAQGLGTVAPLRPRSVSEARAEFDVHTPLTAYDLARQLSSRGLPDGDVQILQVTANTLRCNVQSVGVAP